MLAKPTPLNINLGSVRFSMFNNERDISPAMPAAPQLIPVMVTAEQDAVATRPSSVAETIEIDLAGKYRVRVSSGVDAQALRRVLDVLERR